MTDFIKYLTNGKFIGAYNASKEGNKDAAEKGLVYIEDDSDQVFWEKFINFHYPNQYNVQASIKDRSGERGKRALEQLYTGANKKALIAIDTDYDLICPSSNPKYSNYLINNKFIIHTVGYSRESALLDKKHLSVFFKSVKYTIQHNIDIETFINKLSPLAFEGLVLFSNELNTGNSLELIPSEFHKCFNILDQKIVKDNLILDESLLKIIDNNLQSYFKNTICSDEARKDAEMHLKSIGINPDNAYRFISGHTIYDLILKIHLQLVNTLYDLELVKIKSEYKGQELGERISQFNTKFKMQSAIETFCHCYPIQNDDEIHSKISEIISLIA